MSTFSTLLNQWYEVKTAQLFHPDYCPSQASIEHAKGIQSIQLKIIENQMDEIIHAQNKA